MFQVTVRLRSAYLLLMSTPLERFIPCYEYFSTEKSKKNLICYFADQSGVMAQMGSDPSGKDV